LALLIVLGIHISLPMMLAQQATSTATPTPARNGLLVADAFVRGGPGEGYIPVGQVIPSTQLIPFNISVDGNWVLIRYNTGFGWIRRDLAFWVVNIDALPVLEPNLTPTPAILTNTPFFPTGTPSTNYVAVNAISAFIRGGPGRTYLRLGQLYPGDALEPVGRNTDTTWILVRFGEESGFGWLRRDLGVWFSDLESLPVLSELNLTPTLTFTPSITFTPSATATQTPSPTATATATLTPTDTHTPTDEPTRTPTDEPTQTPTDSPTLTATPEPSATSTNLPTQTPTDSPTLTATPEPSATSTDLPTQTPTDSPTLTATPEPSATSTDLPTQTPTDSPTLTATPEPTITLESRSTDANAVIAMTDLPPLTLTSEPSATLTQSPTETATDAPTSTTTPEPSPTETDSPTNTAIGASPTQTITAIADISATSTATDEGGTQIAAVITVTLVQPTPAPLNPTPSPTPPSDGQGGGLAAEAIAAGVIVLGIFAYLLAYLRGAAGAKRYANGFIIEACPVCHDGHLTVESRTERNLGIPNTRHLVKCDNWVTFARDGRRALALCRRPRR